jgi:hypothetical protein
MYTSTSDFVKLSHGQETAKTDFPSVENIKFAYRIIGAASNHGNTTTPPLLILNHFRSSIELWEGTLLSSMI